MFQAEPETLLGHHRCCPHEPNYRAGELIFSPGEDSGHLYYLHSGRVKLYHLDPGGRCLTLDLIGQGQWFGKIGWKGSGPGVLYAEAMSEACVCSVSRQTLLQALRERPEQALGLLEKLDQRERAMVHHLAEMFYAHVPRRIAQGLLLAGERWGQVSSEGTTVRITHSELGNLIGAARETTTACLQALVRRGVVETQNRAILIRDADRLRKLANQEELLRRVSSAQARWN